MFFSWRKKSEESQPAPPPLVQEPERPAVKEQEPSPYVQTMRQSTDALIETIVEILHEHLPQYALQYMDRELEKKDLMDLLSPSLEELTQSIVANYEKVHKEKMLSSVQHFQNSVRELREQMEEKELIIEGHQQQVLSFERQKRTLKDKIDVLEAQINAQKEKDEQTLLQRQQLEKRISEEQQNVKDRESKISALQETINQQAEMLLEVVQLKQSLDAAQAKLEREQESQYALQQKNNLLEQSIQSMKEQLKEAEQLFQESNIKLISEQNVAKSAVEQLNDLQRVLLQTQEQLAEEHEINRSGALTKETEIIQIKEKLNQLEAEKNRSEEKIQLMQETINHQSMILAEAEALKLSLMETQKQLAQDQETLLLLQQEKVAMTRSTKSLNEQLHETEQLLKESVNQLVTEQIAAKKAVEQLSELQKTFDQTKEQLLKEQENSRSNTSSQAAKINQLTEQIRLLEKEKETLAQNTERKLQEMETSISKQSFAMDKEREKAQALEADCHKQIKQLQKELVEKEAQKRTLIERYSEQIEVLNDTIYKKQQLLEKKNEKGTPSKTKVEKTIKVNAELDLETESENWLTYPTLDPPAPVREEEPVVEPPKATPQHDPAQMSLW